MATEGVHATDDPAVVVDDVTGVGKLQLMRPVIGPAGGANFAPGDTTDGYLVQARNTQGPITSGTPIGTTKPVPIGVRGNDSVPVPVDTADDFTWLWGGQDGALNVYTRLDGALIRTATVQSVAANYVSGDVIGNVLQFTNATLAANRGCTINGLTCLDTTGTGAADIKVALFGASPAGVPADSALFTGLTWANRLAANPIALVSFPAANFDNGFCDGQINGGPFAKNAFPAGTTIYGVAFYGTTAKAAASGAYGFVLDVTYN